MIDKEFAEHFAKDWVEAWNSHNLDAILSHYRDDFEMSSPFIVSFEPLSGGTLKGKDAIRRYWSAALQKFEHLHFEFEAVFVGAGSVAILYKSVLDKRAIEVFFFDENMKVAKAAAHYV